MKIQYVLLVTIPAVVSKMSVLESYIQAKPAKLTKCPNLQTLGSPFVQSQFEEERMQGFWYELAVKKDTQPRFCQCQTSNKTINADQVSMTDKFATNCLGLGLSGKLNYQFSETPGIWTVNFDIPFFRRNKYPNAAVDVGVNAKTGKYDWMIEFSCKELKNDKIFFAINMYSRTYENPEKRIALMVATARGYGLGPYIDEGKDLHYPDHTKCNHK